LIFRLLVLGNKYSW